MVGVTRAGMVSTISAWILPFVLMRTKVFASVVLRRAAVGLAVDAQPHGSVQVEPLLDLRTQSYVGESVLPLRETNMHQHKTEVVRERLCHEVPAQSAIEEPNLRVLVGWAGIPGLVLWYTRQTFPFPAPHGSNSNTLERKSNRGFERAERGELAQESA